MDTIVTIAIVAVVLIIIVLITCYRKAPPNEAIVVTGVGHREPKVVNGRGVVVLPILQRSDRLTMRMMKLDVKTPETGVKTSEGVPLWMDSVVTVQVYSNTSTLTEGEVEQSGCKTATNTSKPASRPPSPTSWAWTKRRSTRRSTTCCRATCVRSWPK